jgi:hypothetical protein
MGAMEITGQDLQDMARHWLGTRPNGYLGSAYGSDLERLLQMPASAGLADQLIAKLRADISVMAQLSADQLFVGWYQEGADKLFLTLEVSGQSVLLNVGERSVSQV